MDPGMEVGPFFVAPGLAKLPAQKASLPDECGHYAVSIHAASTHAAHGIHGQTLTY